MNVNSVDCQVRRLTFGMMLELLKFVLLRLWANWNEIRSIFLKQSKSALRFQLAARQRFVTVLT